jgi:hypothetical protein
MHELQARLQHMLDTKNIGNDLDLNYSGHSLEASWLQAIGYKAASLYVGFPKEVLQHFGAMRSPTAGVDTIST